MKFEKFVGSNEGNLKKQESLLEMARVDDPHNMPFKNKKSVWVYSDDRNKMTPHFHYYLDGSKKIYLEITNCHNNGYTQLKIFNICPWSLAFSHPHFPLTC